MDFDLNVALGLDTCEESASDEIDIESIVDSLDYEDAVGHDGNFREEAAKIPDISHVVSILDEIEGSVRDETATGCVHSNGDVIAEMETKLQTGAAFGSLEQAHLFYCEYGRQKRFSVRRGDQRFIGQTKQIRWKDFVCHCAELPYSGLEKEVVRGFRKQVKRTNCVAKIRVYPVGPGLWKNTLFYKEHNHPLIRSSRILSESRLSVLQSMNSVGIPVNMACGFMEVECGGPQNVGYIRKDAYDKLRWLKKDKQVKNGDSVALLDYFNSKTNSEPFFFWKGVYDVDGRLKHFFFRDSRCLSDYQCFGDIVSIDTTYKTNNYNLSCAPFVGVNHHSTSIMFGVGFLSDETSETFEWLLGVFLESMHGKQPKVVFSDQCRALMNRIDRIFPNSTHRLCQWHVNNNAFNHFGNLNSNAVFKKMWHRCMNWVESEEEFEDLWGAMMSEHVPAENTWLPEMYRLGRRWASVFSQNIFTAGMVATSRSKGTNRVLKAMISSSTSLYEFACTYDKIQARWRDIERAEDGACLWLWLPGQFVKKNEMLTQAATVYTRNIYKKLEHQCIEVWNVVVDWRNALQLRNGDVEFKASRSEFPNSRSRTVTFNISTNTARCSCHLWERSGILCRHILKVYQFMDVKLIPDEFILKRWTKNAKQQVFAAEAFPMIPHHNNLPCFLDFSNLMLRSEYEMVAASNGCLKAQEYLIKMMERTKMGFTAHLNNAAAEGAGGSAPGDKFQFLNPNKVKQKGPKKDNDIPKTREMKKRRGGSKCPGICTRSRKRKNPDEGPTLSPTEVNIYLSQPYHDSQFGRFGEEASKIKGDPSFFYATQ